MSLKKKLQYVYTISSIVIAAMLMFGILLSIKGIDILTDTLDSNNTALELYNAVTKERNLLKLYLRVSRKYCQNRLVKPEITQKEFLTKFQLIITQ